MQFLTKTKWPVPVIIGLVVLLFVLENYGMLKPDQVRWIEAALAVLGAQAGVHTDKPNSPATAPTDPPKHIVIPGGDS